MKKIIILIIITLFTGCVLKGLKSKDLTIDEISIPQEATHGK